MGRVARGIAALSLLGCEPDDATSRAEAEVSAAQPFVIASWNLEYFGSTTVGEGPVDKDRQAANARAVIARLAPDVIGLEEITSETRFDELRAALPDHDGLTSFDPRVEGGAEGYANDPYRLGVLFKPRSLELLRARVVRDIDLKHWPLEVTFAVNVAGTRTELTLIVVHFMSGANTFAHGRRKDAADRLERYIDAELAGRMVAVVGDWNDDIDVSIVEGVPTPWATPFTRFRDDRARYRFTTGGLSEAGQGTTAYPSTIDHHLTTNELAARFISHSAWVERPGYIDRFLETTSDHYPVITRYAFAP